jgi:hypothetical protein
MTTQKQKPPPGTCFMEDYTNEETGEVIDGIATRLSLSVSAYKKWRMRGEGPHTVKYGKRVLARIEVVDAWLARLGTPEPDPVAARESRPPEPRKAPGARRKNGANKSLASTPAA